MSAEEREREKESEKNKKRSRAERFGIDTQEKKEEKLALLQSEEEQKKKARQLRFEMGLSGSTTEVLKETLEKKQKRLERFQPHLAHEEEKLTARAKRFGLSA
mmetsp:Transcript_22890/g.23110  ORF Transcript_22890/g.23110 Transcript_22890/m.23110 type:complete len:103 (+) Transcript_22890:257-565(+)